MTVLMWVAPRAEQWVDSMENYLAVKLVHGSAELTVAMMVVQKAPAKVVQ